jgi:hypothetical protein
MYVRVAFIVVSMAHRIVVKEHLASKILFQLLLCSSRTMQAPYKIKHEAFVNRAGLKSGTLKKR